MARKAGKSSQVAPKRASTKPAPKATGVARIQRATRASAAALVATLTNALTPPDIAPDNANTVTSDHRSVSPPPSPISSPAHSPPPTHRSTAPINKSISHGATSSGDPTPSSSKSRSSTTSSTATPSSSTSISSSSTSRSSSACASTSTPTEASPAVQVPEKDNTAPPEDDVDILKALIAQQKAELDRRDKAEVAKANQLVKVPKPEPLGKLIDAMQLADDTVLYNCCRVTAVKTVCVEARIPSSVPWHKQDPNILSKAAKHAKLLEPHLALYENDWAIFEIMKGSNKNK
ncbi:hypothetical protein AGABI2DRAFT_122506 [Agaricus bisporus var. bisporus H97]|uniref:hypothetical protein n=1 Tax=Agaricus bisporus var. bisporus (strain H97 / ATCC MYA-4626 / FGSC 10389) TaxID=936046 RepID=UPI00029F60B9|nr:hypothetical protein AGABI2DRAFT_122506 [Agaricus bisporus var. bisporus H97]EKV42937.1 hypothetical protein AGABI2DRAFT_122506 [Agaricus bisporus var. bisporus H97]